MSPHPIASASSPSKVWVGFGSSANVRPAMESGLSRKISAMSFSLKV